MNTFQAIHEARDLTDPRTHVAVALAQAFICSNGDKDSLYACLRLQERLSAWKLVLTVFPDAHWFKVDVNPDHPRALADLDGWEFTEACEVFRQEAYEFLGEDA